MDLMIVENTMSYCLFALALACLATFLSAMQEEFIRRRRRKQSAHSRTKIVPPSIAVSKPKQSGSERPMVRGYDTPELFREDLWLRRVEQSRNEIAVLDASRQCMNPNQGSREEFARRVCAILAQHSAARCDN